MVWYLDEKFSQDRQTPNKVIKGGKVTNYKYKIPKINKFDIWYVWKTEKKSRREKREDG